MNTKVLGARFEVPGQESLQSAADPRRAFGAMVRAIPSDQVSGCIGPCWVLKLKAGTEQASGNDAPGFEDEFGFGPHQESADLDHPLRGGQADAGAPGF